MDNRRVKFCLQSSTSIGSRLPT